MAEGCPARAALESFAGGSMAEAERADVEAHLDHCLACAKELENLTRAELELLVGHGSPTAALRPATSPVLDTVMRRAAESEGGSPRLETGRVLAILDPQAGEGALGSFAGYDILEIAGRGGMGVVLKARDRTLDRLVAIKVIFPTGTRDDSFSARFLDEARAVAAIHHDHIVTVHHAGMAKGLAYLVMPFHAEGTLQQLLASSPKLAPKDVARVGLQLARALAAMHARKILHRDIKPSNVLLEQRLKRVRLADFGLAQTRDVTTEQFASGGSRRQQAQTGINVSGDHQAPLAPGATNPGKRTVAGTPHYMSPEQARGEALDARSDLFGLGAVLFQMATGRTHYPGESSEEVLRAASRGDVKPVREAAPETPPALASIIDRLRARRAEDRFSSAEEVAGEFEKLLNTERHVRFWLKRAAAAAMAACLLAGTAVLGLDWSGRTAIINSILCRRTGETHYIRGRFGTYTRLPDALAAARPGEVIEMRFSGERLMDPFRVGGKPLTIRAVPGYTPVLVATNNGQPMILVDAPLTLEGLTLWRRGPVANFVPVISVENAPLHLLNCRVIRSRFQGQNVLVWGQTRGGAMSEVPPMPLQRTLLAFQEGSAGYLQNCVVAGVQTTAIGLRASTNQPVRIEAENNLFVTDRTLSMKLETETRIDLRFAHSVLLTGALLDLDETGPVKGITASWVDCVVDRTPGALVRVNQVYGRVLLRALEWKETNVVYAGEGSFAINRRKRGLDSEAEWNELMRLTADSHRILPRQAFPATCARSALQLNAIDLDMQVVKTLIEGGKTFAPQFIGEGKAYAVFRQEPAYREWQRFVRDRSVEWEDARAASAVNAAR